MNIYVGNLSFKAEEQDLVNLFEEFGDVSSVKIITDRETGKSRGFAFVEMPDEDDALAAIEELNSNDFLGRSLVVNQARDRQPRSNNRFGGGGGGGWK